MVSSFTTVKSQAKCEIASIYLSMDLALITKNV